MYFAFAVSYILANIFVFPITSFGLDFSYFLFEHYGTGDGFSRELVIGNDVKKII